MTLQPIGVLIATKHLIVNEDLTAVGTDILANQLNIYTNHSNFSSRVSFDFKHTYAGVGFYWQQEVYHTHSGRAIWFSIALPVMHVRNQVTITETILNNGGGTLGGTVASTVEPLGNGCATCIQSSTLPIPRAADVTAAFAQPGWCYGRINSGQSMSKTALSNVELRAALQVANNEHSHMESWLGVNIPTGNTPQGINVFEPVVGDNHHWAAFLGSSFGVHVYENEKWDLVIFSEFDFNIQYFFAHNEVRSFDLIDRPWSRYMQYYSSVAQATTASNSVDPVIGLTLHTPGINLLTQSLNVKPGYARTFNVAWDLLWKKFELEVGYNFYARQAECINSGCNLPQGLALKHIGPLSESGSVGDGITDPGQFIFNNFIEANSGYSLTGPGYQALTSADFDLDSAAAPALLSHTFYASLAYDVDCYCYPVFVSVGGSYEFAPDNTGVEKWMAFGKVGVSF